jgi:hypothetical protein
MAAAPVLAVAQDFELAEKPDGQQMGNPFVSACPDGAK